MKSTNISTLLIIEYTHDIARLHVLVFDAYP